MWTFFGIVSVVLMIWAIIDILKSKFKGEYDKLLWILLVIFLGIIGVILYYFIGRKNKIG